MPRSLQDPQRLVDLIALQMYLETKGSGKAEGPIKAQD
jgi:hypothetical protein